MQLELFSQVEHKLRIQFENHLCINVINIVQYFFFVLVFIIDCLEFEIDVLNIFTEIAMSERNVSDVAFEHFLKEFFSDGVHHIVVWSHVLFQSCD